ncbi:MAG: hypothetical protein QXJ81_06800 [Metallosphaera sp.]
MYTSIPASKLVVDLKTAKIIRYVSNVFLAAKISFANEIATSARTSVWILGKFLKV